MGSPTKQSWTRRERKQAKWVKGRNRTANRKARAGKDTIAALKRIAGK